MAGHELGRSITMSLRVRLVVALGLLLTIGLVAFGFGTYGPYSSSQYRKLDDRLRAILPGASNQLITAAGLTGDPFGPGGGTEGGGPPIVAPTGTFAELIDASGTVIQTLSTTSTSTPKLPAAVAKRQTTTVDSATGSGQWRVYADDAFRLHGYVVVVAIPTNEVADSLRRLVLIELIGGGTLLAVLSAGSWLILRRGLRPLEKMATTARSISAGDLSQRVEPSDGKG
jgi:two-component system OmpR family sensor kinase